MFLELEEDMGCLKSLIHKIIFIAVVVAFFAFGGYSFVQKLINDYQNPTRSEFSKAEMNYGNFSSVPTDYQLSRSFNLFGYKKINAKYLPTSQKITIYDLRDEKIISPNDFKTKAIDKKLNDFLDKLKDSLITLEDFQIVERGNYIAKNKTVPYVKFQAKIKNIPFSNKTGIVAAYSTTNQKAKNPSTKLVFTMTDTKAFNPVIVSGFVKSIRF